MEKHSRQREAIIELLKQRNDHPTAEMLYLSLKQEYPSMGIATVYRNLVKLCSENKVVKIKTEEGVDRFDSNLFPHIHFVCDKCHVMHDVFLNNEEMENLITRLFEHVKTIEAKTDKIQIIINGTCKQCRQKKEEEKK